MIFAKRSEKCNHHDVIVPFPFCACFARRCRTSHTPTCPPHSPEMPKNALVVCSSIIVVVFAIALHGIDNTSSLNVVFPVVLDGIQALFGCARKNERMFEYADDGLPLCNKCHCTPSWEQDPETFECPKGTPPPWQYSQRTIDTLKAQQVINPYSLKCNPYSNETCDTVPSLEKYKWGKESICGLLFQKPHTSAKHSWRQHVVSGNCPLTNYTLQTFSSTTEATNVNAVITHTGPCGACSTTQDLAAYMQHPDMVAAGRRCTNKILLFGHSAGVACYEALGFTTPCATIWTYNSQNTATVCRKTCVRHLFSPPNQPEPHCRLNECLYCDEVRFNVVSFVLVAQSLQFAYSIRLYKGQEWTQLSVVCRKDTTKFGIANADSTTVSRTCQY